MENNDQVFAALYNGTIEGKTLSVNLGMKNHQQKLKFLAIFILHIKPYANKYRMSNVLKISK